MSEKINEKELIKTIVIGSDWEEVITNIIDQENINPSDVDIVKLVDAFMDYLHNMERFDFRIPARFILIAAILLRMKCEVLKIKEIKTGEKQLPNIKIDVPLLDLPIIRRPTKKITLSDLINALNKVIEFEERKKNRKLQIRRAVESLINEEEDIESRINRVFEEIKNNNISCFSQLVQKWERKSIVEKFIPLLHLANSNLIRCNQEETFGEIYISLVKDEVSDDNLVVKK